MIMQFIAEQWMLVSVLVALICVWIMYESRLTGKSLTPSMLSQMVNQQKAQVVDLRDKSEFKVGHIAGAINIAHAELTTSVSKLEKYKANPIILVCKVGQHSSMISKVLNKQGFQVYRLGGGIGEWQHSQMPLIKA